ncbi:MAG: hypothetical protein KJ645_09710 [Planctomycetes bacterium]|nr:hypothetical protein [Planctomycetota bacterium]
MRPANILIGFITCALVLSGFLSLDDGAEAAIKPPALGIEADQQQEPEENPQEKWDRLSENEKKEVLEKYAFFKSLPESERHLLKERHKKLQAIREGLDDFDMLTPEDRYPRDHGKESTYERIKRFLKKRLDKVKMQLKFTFKGEAHDRLEEIRRMREELENLNQQQMDPFLEKMVEEGVIEPGEVEPIKACPRHERRERLFSLDQRRRMRELEGFIPSHEEERLREMEPWRFHQRMHTDREPWSLYKPVVRLGALTREQKDAVHRLPYGPDRKKVIEGFVESNLRERLEKMGVKPELLDKAFEMSQEERQEWIFNKLNTLKEKGIRLPPDIDEALESEIQHRRERGRDEEASEDREDLEDRQDRRKRYHQGGREQQPRR